MSHYEAVQRSLRQSPRSWLVTGCAGFIGSNLLEALLSLDQNVVGLDNLSTGYQKNLEEVQKAVGARAWSRFRFIEGDICDIETCHEGCDGVNYVLHQAALGSVPRSLADPLATNASNITGFLNLLVAARDAEVARFVYAASSSTYGDHPALPKVENRIGAPLSPYAVTKYVNELYAKVFERNFGIETVGLRYFNVFGRRQDPNGAYAAVIPKWVGHLLRGEECVINGDGETSRDFCYIDNAVQANVLAATAVGPEVTGEVYNVALGKRLSLNELFAVIRDELSACNSHLASAEPRYADFRPGDVRHSQADITKARERLAYEPGIEVRRGLELAVDWYRRAELSPVDG